MRSEIKSISHQGYLGIENCQKGAHQALFWPLIDKELEDMISECSTSLTYRNRQRSKAAIKPKIPAHSWTKCAAELFCLQSHYYLLIINYYLKFVAAENLQNLQSETVINKCKQVFTQFGTPKELIMDNGPKFSCQNFCSFSKPWDRIHKAISPHYHQSNDLAERSIQRAKQTLNKAKMNFEDHFLTMLSLNSKLDKNGTLPAEKLFSHKLRTILLSLIISTQSVTTEKNTVTQNLRRKPPEITRE